MMMTSLSSLRSHSLVTSSRSLLFLVVMLAASGVVWQYATIELNGSRQMQANQGKDVASFPHAENLKEQEAALKAKQQKLNVQEEALKAEQQKFQMQEETLNKTLNAEHQKMKTFQLRMSAELNEQQNKLHAQEKALNKTLAEQQNFKTFQEMNVAELSRQQKELHAHEEALNKSLVQKTEAERLVKGAGDNRAANVGRYTDPKHQSGQQSQQHMAPTFSNLPPDLHSSHLDIMELLDWEEASLKGIVDYEGPEGPEMLKASEESCRPPKGVSKACCLGSFSSGGGVNPSKRGTCGASLKNLDQVKESAKYFFFRNPLPPGKGFVQCDMCRIVDLARHSNLTLALIGDSMHAQVMGGLSCELERRNYIVETKRQSHDRPKVFWRQKHAHTVTIHVRSPLWPSNQVVTIHYHMIYKLPLVEGGGDLLALTAQADVVVLGFGLHWRFGTDAMKGKPAFIKTMSDTFTQIKEQGHVKLLVHREVSAQHFDANGGEFTLQTMQTTTGWSDFWAKGRNPKGWSNRGPNKIKACKAFQSDDSSVYWREKTIKKAVNASGYTLVMASPNMPAAKTGGHEKEVVVLPFFNYTSQHYYMHPHAADCTHYCGSPFMYYPLWRSLRFAMDRTFAVQD